MQDFVHQPYDSTQAWDGRSTVRESFITSIKGGKNKSYRTSSSDGKSNLNISRSPTPPNRSNPDLLILNPTCIPKPCKISGYDPLTKLEGLTSKRVVVKIMVPFWGSYHTTAPIPKRDPNFDNHPKTLVFWIPRSTLSPKTAEMNTPLIPRPYTRKERLTQRIHVPK